jgi:hypothetical protein
MKKIVIVVMLFAVTFMFAQNVSIESPMGSFKMNIEASSSQSSPNAVSVVDAIAERLEMLEKNFHSKLNKLDQKRAANITNEIYDLLALLPEDFYASIEAPSPSSQPVQQSTDATMNINLNISEPAEAVVMEEKKIETAPTNSAMSEREFQQLYANVEDESFADDQLSVVRIATKSKYFTIDQLTRLLDLFSFSDDKIECVQMVYPRVVDKDNAHNLLKAFTYSDDKKQVERIINR